MDWKAPATRSLSLDESPVFRGVSMQASSMPQVSGLASAYGGAPMNAPRGGSSAKGGLATRKLADFGSSSGSYSNRDLEHVVPTKGHALPRVENPYTMSMSGGAETVSSLGASVFSATSSSSSSSPNQLSSESAWSSLAAAPTWIRLVSSILCLGTGCSVFAALVDTFVQQGVCYDVDEQSKEIYCAAFACKESTFMVRLYEYTRQVGQMLDKMSPGCSLPTQDSGPVVVVEFTRSSGCAFAFSKSFAAVVRALGRSVLMPEMPPEPRTVQQQQQSLSIIPRPKVLARVGQETLVGSASDTSLANLVAMAGLDKCVADQAIRALADLVTLEENAHRVRLQLKEDCKSSNGGTGCVQGLLTSLTNENDANAARMACDVVCSLLCGARECSKCTWEVVGQFVGPMVAVLGREAANDATPQKVDFFDQIARSRMTVKLLRALDAVVTDFEADFMADTELLAPCNAALQQMQHCSTASNAVRDLSASLLQRIVMASSPVAS